MAAISTIEEIEQVLRQLSPERFRSVVDFARYLLYEQYREATKDQADPNEANTSEWLALAEGSFEFWDNEKDAAYDKL